MTKLPEKNVLSGTKTPKTTTGEMKNALGKLRDYLAELFGDDSQNKEVARQSLGIDLSALATRPDLESALSEKADKTELAGKADRDAIRTLKEAIAKLGIPVGSIRYFAMRTPPAGYLKADGSEVERQAYPDLFTAIGTTFGSGDGVNTFHLPDLRGEFIRGFDDSRGVDEDRLFGSAQGDAIRNITGDWVSKISWSIAEESNATGAIYKKQSKQWNSTGTTAGGGGTLYGLDASLVVPTAEENRPRNIALLACIKAFDPVTNPGLIG